MQDGMQVEAVVMHYDTSGEAAAAAGGGGASAGGLLLSAHGGVGQACRCRWGRGETCCCLLWHRCSVLILQQQAQLNSLSRSCWMANH
jgi:hypothetical protein